MKNILAFGLLGLAALSFTSCCNVKSLFGGSCGNTGLPLIQTNSVTDVADVTDVAQSEAGSVATKKSSIFSRMFGCGSNKQNGHCGETLTKTVTEIEETTHNSSKGGAYVTSEIVTKEVQVPVTCPDCITKFKPCPKCCGGVSDTVIRRASAQGWNGNPHIGLIPTMKVLAE